jgi:Plasmid pRiA4b ORF-3-like protein
MSVGAQAESHCSTLWQTITERDYTPAGAIAHVCATRRRIRTMSPVSRGRKKKKRPTSRSPNARRFMPGLAGVHAELLGAFRPVLQATDPLEVEVLTSDLLGSWWKRLSPGEDPDALFGEGAIGHAARAGTQEAMALLRALAILGVTPCSVTRPPARRRRWRRTAWPTHHGRPRGVVADHLHGALTDRQSVDPAAYRQTVDALRAPSPRGNAKAAVVPTRDTVYQVKIALHGTRPPIWRRLRLPAATTLAQLHQVVQVAFGWGTPTCMQTRSMHPWVRSGSADGFSPSGCSTGTEHRLRNPGGGGASPGQHARWRAERLPRHLRDAPTETSTVPSPCATTSTWRR